MPLFTFAASDVTVSSAATSNGAFSGVNPAVFTPTGTPAVANNGTIQISLNAGNGVTVNTASGAGGNGDLVVGSTVSKSSGTSSALILNAVRDLTVNSTIGSSLGALPVTLSAGRNLSITQAITTNGGALILAPAQAGTLGASLNSGTGSVQLQSGGLDMASSYTITTSTFSTASGTWLGYRGTITGNLFVSGTVSPGGVTTDTISVSQSFTLASSATTVIDLGGASPGSQYDSISVSGAVVIAGSLQLNFLNGFENSIVNGHSFTIISGASITGNFNGLPDGTRITLPNELGSVKINYTATTVTISDWQPVMHELSWDTGTVDSGSLVYSNTNSRTGRFYFHINAQATDINAWKTRLTVATGEADLYLYAGSVPQTTSYYQYKSERIGSDGIMLPGNYYTVGQDWYILVNVTTGGQWSVFTGRPWVQDLGTLGWTDTNANGVYDIGEPVIPSGSGPVTMPVEGIRFFKTIVPTGTPAWSLWLNGDSRDLAVRKNYVPFPALGSSYYDRKQSGQMLVVSPYLTGLTSTYFLGVNGNPGDVVNLDSRIQVITDISFNSTQSNVAVTDLPYRVYRVQVPVQQIAWDVAVTPSLGDANVCVRRDNPPAEFDNDAYSEVPGTGVTDSVTLVPDFLTNATWFITVYGTSSYTFSLQNGPPTITPLSFTDTKINDQPTRVGWRFYALTDINSQLGCLGWELDLANQVPGTEIAIRRNAVPSQWNYRTNGNTYVYTGSRVDVSGMGGFLQHPGHQADIWYVGVYTPTQPLGTFTLTSAPITPPITTFNGGTLSALNQEPGRWKYSRVDVPAGALGWDVRVTGVSGVQPQMVVCRDQLPINVQTSNQWYSPQVYTSWASGYQWAASNGAGADWSSWYYDIGAPTYALAPPRLLMAMGRPLEAGTYYVGVYNSSTTLSSNNTIDSRGIGASGSGLTYEVAPTLAYIGGVATITNLAPREAKYFKVTIPANTPSWEVTLDPSVGEMCLVVRQGAIPDFTASKSGDANTVLWTAYADMEVKMQKAGPERYVMLPQSGQSYIPPGDYYLAVVGEGLAPASNTIGTGLSSGRLTSVGPLSVTSLGSASNAGLIQPVSLAGGQIKAFTFTVPANTNSLEVRLDSPTGSPKMRVYPGSVIPTPPDSWNYGSDGGGSWNDASPIFTQASPTAGTWTAVVQAASTDSVNYPDATANLVFTALTPVPLTFDAGTQPIVNQPTGSWRYFQVIVPAGVLGWDVRLTGVSGVQPTMVVCRDLVPNNTQTTGQWYYGPQTYTNWTSGYQWAAGNGASADWSSWYYDIGAPTYALTPPRLLMAMGRPLESGTYNVGVYNSSTTVASSYTIDSRGIGTAGSGLTYEVAPTLAYTGGAAVITNLAPREAKYFKVTIPSNTPSWEVSLSPSAGEMCLVVRQGAIPDFTASKSGDANTVLWSSYADMQVKMQKAGPEHYVMLPASGQSYIPAGDYYLAVVGEGVAPASNTIGTGVSSGTITSVGLLSVTSLGSASNAGLVQPVSLAGGQIKAFTFTVPAHTNSLEARLDSPTGSPQMRVYPGSIIPTPPDSWNYGSDGGGTGYNASPIFTQASPTAGTWTAVVQAASTDSVNYPDATANLVFTALAPVPLAFDGGTQAIVNQPTGSWRYYQVTVPAGVLGWDVRLTGVSGVQPAMVVCRDLLPSNTQNSGQWYYGPQSYTSWTSGYQWAAGNGASADWSSWYYDIGAPTYALATPRLLMAMGRPLESGTYYVGVYNSSTTVASSYTIDSRGVGAAGSGLTYEVAPTLAFAGGAAAITNLAPREASYFKVTIPANTPSWEVTLNPSVGEMCLVVRQGAIPDFTATRYGDANTVLLSSYADMEVKMQKAGPERYVMLPQSGQSYIPAGDYYLAVVGEGVNPGNSTIGTGVSSGTLTSVGPLTVTNLGSATGAGLTQPVSLAGGQCKAFTFTVPVNTNSLEVRLDNATGAPKMRVYPGSVIPAPPDSWNYGSDGGGSYNDASPIFTQANPTVGTWTAVVQAASADSVTYPNATASIVVTQKQNIPLNFDVSQNAGTPGVSNTDSQQMIDGQYTIYQVTPPATLAGQPVIGWILKTNVLQGAVSLQVYKNFANPNSGVTINNTFAVVVPPFLTFGDTWYVRVKATGLTNYTIISEPVTLQRPVWQMPTGFNLTFGDSGNDSVGNPLPGDQGIDLAQGEWHFYAVDVPDGNAGLLRTELQAISGNPDLYIRETGVPTTDHSATGPLGTPLYDRSLTGATTEYGNWVPLDAKTQKQLAPGRWYLGVKAGGSSNVRYRLLASTGQVTDLALNGGSANNQVLADNDWRYYRFTVPADAPNNWALTFSQQVGDVVMWLRDTVPPGHGNINNSAYYYIESWYSDNKNQGPYSYNGHDAAGTYNFNTPPLRPGHTYFAGFRSNNSATFSVSSATSGGSIGLLPSLDFYSGSVSTIIPANSSVIYQIPVPAEATRFKYSSTHDSTVQVRIEQGTLSGTTGNQHYISYGANSTLNRSLATSTWPPLPGPSYYAAWPWQPNQTYYVRFVNTNASAMPITFMMNGKNGLTEDEDNDGLPDYWEMFYFGHLGYGLNSDPDHDGITLLMDYAFNLNPTLNQSAHLPKPVVSGGNLSLTFYAGSLGVTYTVQTSTDLKNWTTTGVTVSAPDINNFRTATVPITGVKCFLRIVLVH